MTLSAPVPLTAEHNIEAFSSGATILDAWLKRHALKNQLSGVSRTFVACTDEQRIVGFYTLAAGSVEAAAATPRFRRNTPDSIPVIILGRLAVDSSARGHGIGRGLVRDAGQRALQAAGIIGARGLLVHALSAEAKGFYEHLGFSPAPFDPMTLMVTLPDLEASL